MNSENEKNGAFFVVYDWMTDVLGLKGNELNVFALIFSFSLNSQGGCFHGSMDYLCCRVGGISKQTARNALGSLLSRQLIIRTVCLPGGFNRYTADLEQLKKIEGIPQNFADGVKKIESAPQRITPNNKRYSKNNNKVISGYQRSYDLEEFERRSLEPLVYRRENYQD